MLGESIKNGDNIKLEFKILYTLGIIFVLMGHSFGGGFSLFNEFFPIYSFHVALFVFASGYFYHQSSQISIKEFIYKKTKKLILPLYLWNVFYAILMSFLKNFGFFPMIEVKWYSLLLDPIINGHQFVLNLAGWFIAPLYMTHLLNIFIRKIFSLLNIKINETIFFIVSLLLGFFGVWLVANGFNKDVFLPLNRLLYFLPFYSLGILYRKYEKYDKINNLAYFGILIFISLLIIYKYGYMPIIYPSFAKFFTNELARPFCVGIIAIAFWLRVSKILAPAIGDSKTVNLIANNTYSIMINHLLGFKILNSIFAFICVKTAFCKGFDMFAYKTAWNYCYIPHNLTQFLILYVIFGIIFSIFFQRSIDFIYSKIKSLLVLKK